MQKIKLSNTPAITTIDCGTSTPKLGGSINLSTFPNLISFKCVDNDIASVDSLSRNVLLQTLRLENNNLTTQNIQNITTDIFNNKTSVQSSTNKNIDFSFTGASMGTLDRSVRLNNVNQYKALLDKQNFNVAYAVNDETAQTWNGSGGNDNLSTTGNWSNGVFPLTYDALYFDGTTRLSPVNDLTADIELNGITFNSGAGAFNLTGNRFSLTFDGVTNNSTNSQTVSNDIILLGPNRTINSSAGSITLSGIISGSSSLTKIGSGVLTLSAANTYTGGTVINNGDIVATNSNSLGDAAGTVTVNADCTLYVDANITRTGTVTVNSGEIGTNNGSALTNNGSGGFLLTGNAVGIGLVLAGTAGLTTSANDTRLWSQCSYTGATSINGGAAQLAGSGGISSTSTVSIAAGASFNLTGWFAPVNINRTIGGLTGGGILYGTAGTITVNKTSGVDTFSGDIQGGQGLIKDGAGTLALTGASTYSGPTTVNAGLLVVGHNNALGFAGTSSGTNVVSGAQLRLDSVTIGNENLTISGAGPTGTTWALRNNSGNCTWGGKITLNANSTIQAASGTTLTLDVTSGAAVDLASFTVKFNGAGWHRIKDEITGTGNFVKEGSGTAILTGNNSYTGTTTISLGTLQIGEGGTSGSLSASSVITNNSILTFTRSDSITFSNDISGSGSLIQSGEEELVLSGNNTYTGTTSIIGGSIIVTKVNGVTATATFTNTSLSVTFSAVPDAGTSFVFFPGSTTQSYSTVTLINATGRAATYNSSNSTLTITNA